MAVFCIVTLGAGWWYSYHMLRYLSNLQAETTRRSESHLAGLVHLESQTVVTFATSYSWWDELVTAVVAQDNAWMTANIDPALQDYGMDAAVVMAADGHVAHAIGIDRAHVPYILQRVGGIGTGRTGIINLRIDDQIADVSFGTVHPTADTARATAPRGMILGIRFWNDRRIERISSLFGGTIRMHQDGEEPHPRATSEDHPIHYRLIDNAGLPLATLTAHRPNMELAAVLRYESQGAWLLAAILLVSVVLLFLLVMVLVGTPLRRLAAVADGDDPISAHRLAVRTDEVGAVSAAVASSIDHRRRLALEITERLRAEERLREANKILLSDIAAREQAEHARREAEVRTTMALQGGNLSLWEFVVAENRWLVDHSWLANIGTSMDQHATHTDAWIASMETEDRNTLQNKLDEIRSGTIASLEYPFRLHRDGGGVVWVLMRGAVTERDGNGVAVRVVGTMLDVTRWRDMEQQLRQAQKLESIGQLAAGIAHEINTPIQFIGDNVRFLQDGFTAMSGLCAAYASIVAECGQATAMDRVRHAEGEADMAFLLVEIPKAINQTIEGVQRVATIVRAMKEFAHPGTVELVPSDLNHLIRNAVTITHNTWRYIADVHMDLAADLPLVPLATSDINQALINLIINATHAIEDGHRRLEQPKPGHIRITTQRDGDVVLLSIADTGCGMSPDVRDRIYDPFFTTKEVGRGTGQGLTITRSVIMERHHGTISCVSTPGRGTTFIIRLPICE